MTNKVQIIDKVLHRLYESNGNQIEIDTLLIQLKSYDNIVLTEQEFKEITQTLKAENLCELKSFQSFNNLKLKDNGFEIINKHKSYSNYLLARKKKSILKMLVGVLSIAIVPFLTNYYFDVFRANNGDSPNKSNSMELETKAKEQQATEVKDTSKIYLEHHKNEKNKLH